MWKLGNPKSEVQGHGMSGEMISLVNNSPGVPAIYIEDNWNLKSQKELAEHLLKLLNDDDR